jgi:hypothetical protein
LLAGTSDPCAGTDPRDLLQSQFVDLVRLHRDRRRGLNEEVVQLTSALHVDEADALSRLRQVFLLEKVAQLAIRRIEFFRHRAQVGGAQPLPVGLADPARKLGHRAVVRRLLGLLLQLKIELLDHVPDRHPGFDDAGGEALAEAIDRALEHRGELAVPLEIVLVVGQRPERRGALAGRKRRIEGVDAAEVIDRTDDCDPEDGVLETFQCLFLPILEDVVRDPVHLIELRPVDLLERSQLAFCRGLLGREVRIAAIVAQPIRIAEVTTEDSNERVPLQVCFVALVKERTQFLPFGLRLGPSAGRVLRRDGGSQRDGGDERREDSLHRWSVPASLQEWCMAHEGWVGCGSLPHPCGGRGGRSHPEEGMTGVGTEGCHETCPLPARGGRHGGVTRPPDYPG